MAELMIQAVVELKSCSKSKGDLALSMSGEPCTLDHPKVYRQSRQFCLGRATTKRKFPAVYADKLHPPNNATP